MKIILELIQSKIFGLGKKLGRSKTGIEIYVKLWLGFSQLDVFSLNSIESVTQFRDYVSTHSNVKQSTLEGRSM